MRSAFIETLTELAARDERVFLMTADLGFSVVEKFARTYPSRFLNVGVAEANMVGLATGLAMDGWIPYVYSMATFAPMRAYEQIRNGPVIHSLPVRIIGIGGGFAYGTAGITHFGLEDLAIMRTLPGMTVIAPADPDQTRSVLRSCHEHPGPVYFRIGKGGNPRIPGLEGRFGIGRVECFGEGSDLLLLCTGAISTEVAAAAADLEGQQVRCTVGVVAALSPAPHEALASLASRFRHIVTIEEHFEHGGLGSLAAEAIALSGASARLHPLAVRGIPDGILGSQDFMRRRMGISRSDIVLKALSVLERRKV